jgi:hypothetical protein
MRITPPSSRTVLTSARGIRFATWFVRIWAAMAIAFGIGFAIVGALDWDRAAASVGWPTAQGTITESRVHHTTTSKRGHVRHHHAAHVSFRYSVDGREFTASRITFRNMLSSESAARETVAAHPVGATVTVHYAPEDPGLACLEPGAGDWQWIPIAIGAVSAALGSAIGWFVPRRLEAKLRASKVAGPEDRDIGD